MSRPPAAVSLVMALVMPLAGCGTIFGSDDAASAPTSSSSTSSSTGNIGRQLTKEEATHALPATPSGARSTSVDGTSSHHASDPEECLDVLRQGKTADDLRASRVVSVSRGWRTAAPESIEYTFRIESFSRPVGPELLDRAGAAMSTCGAFSFTGEDDGGTFDDRVLIEPRTVAPLGDQSFADRVTSFIPDARGKAQRVYVDQLVVRVGNNLLLASRIHKDKTTSFDPLEAHAEHMLRDLTETS